MKNLKIDFIWHWSPSVDEILNWQDGLSAALGLLIEDGHEVTVYTANPDTVYHSNFLVEPIKELGDSDVRLCWGSLDMPWDRYSTEIPMLLCLAGGSVENTREDIFKHIFVESPWYLDQVAHPSVSVAFGTNEKLFQPVDLPKTIDYLFPATFAAWKRHELFVGRAKGTVAVACGQIQEHEREPYEMCVENGITVLPQLDPWTLNKLYNMSKTVLITSSNEGGSDRTVLEAMACNTEVQILGDNDKLRHYLGEGREHILQNYTAQHYADELMGGIARAL